MKPPRPPDPDEEGGPSAFAEALAQFERGERGAAAAREAAGEVAVGTRVHGRVVAIGDTHALVDFGGRSEGALDMRPFREDDGTPRIAVGDALDLYVVEAGDQILLAASLRADPRAALVQLREAQAARLPVSGRVTGLNAGGLAVDIGGVRGFCPVSQIEAGYCEDPSVYVGRTLEFEVTAVEEGRGGAVLSRRALLRRAEEQRAKELLATLRPGDERDGVVRRLEPFGAFVDLGGIDGLVHVSEVDYARVAHPRDVLSEGQRVRARVLRIEAGKDGRPRIALSIKAAGPDPWVGIESRFRAGERVTGVVSRLAEFGAFVTLGPGIDGLVHVSEIANERVRHPKDRLAVGQMVEALVLAVDPVKKRIALSLKDDAADEPGRES